MFVSTQSTAGQFEYGGHSAKNQQTWLKPFETMFWPFFFRPAKFAAHTEKGRAQVCLAKRLHPLSRPGCLARPRTHLTSPTSRPTPCSHLHLVSGRASKSAPSSVILAPNFCQAQFPQTPGPHQHMVSALPRGLQLRHRRRLLAQTASSCHFATCIALALWVLRCLVPDHSLRLSTVPPWSTDQRRLQTVQVTREYDDASPWSSRSSPVLQSCTVACRTTKLEAPSVARTRLLYVHPPLYSPSCFYMRLSTSMCTLVLYPTRRPVHEDSECLIICTVEFCLFNVSLTSQSH